MTLKAASKIFLTVLEDEGSFPRMGSLWVWCGSKNEWKQKWKEIYYGCSDKVEDDNGEKVRIPCGYARVRKRNGEYLIICERPFPGSEATTTADALFLLAGAVRDMEAKKHAVRLCGAWAPQGKKGNKWDQVNSRGTTDEVRKIAQDCGAFTQNIPKLGGVAWYFAENTTKETLQEFYRRLQTVSHEAKKEKICPTVSPVPLVAVPENYSEGKWVLVDPVTGETPSWKDSLRSAQENFSSGWPI